MGIGSQRGKGDRGQFAALEENYTARARSEAGRVQLTNYVAWLRQDNGSTCDGLAKQLGVHDLGPDAIKAINKNWYGIGGQAQWRDDSASTPAEIQAVNRVATIYYVERLVKLAADDVRSRVEIWGQCEHPGFSIVVREVPAPGGQANGEAPYLTVDYYVPFNDGEYGGLPKADFARYPEGFDKNPDIGGVKLRVEPLGGVRFYYVPPAPANAKDNERLGGAGRPHVDFALSDAEPLPTAKASLEATVKAIKQARGAQ